MSTLEQEVIEKFQQLDKAAQQRVGALIAQETNSEQIKPANFDYAEWLHDIETLREQIRASHRGDFPQIDAIRMLREIRDGEDQ